MRIIRRHAIIDLLKLPLAGALLAPLAACSVHPIPDDVARVPTIEIVRNIRCEALAGIDSLRPDELARAEPIIKASVIGFDFTFEMTESNGLDSGKADNPFLIFQNSTKFTANVEGGASAARRNVRTFLVMEALDDLRKPASRATCATKPARKNWAYPIGGSIGLDEVVRTYLRVEMLGELQNKPTGPIAETTKFTTAGKHVVFADDITFTTHLEAGANGKLLLQAASGQLKLTTASVNATASRMDTHRVIVALTRKELNVVEQQLLEFGLSGNARQASAIANRRTLVLEGKVTDPRAQALLIQVDEAARTRVAMELYRRRSLYDPENFPAEVLGQRLLDLLKLP